MYFDSVLIGKTPIDQFTAAAGSHALTLVLANYITKEAQVTLKPDKPAAFSTVLMPAFGFLNVSGVPKNARIDFDSGAVCTGEVNQAQISTGWHTVDISNGDDPNNLSDRIRISSGVFYEYKVGSSLRVPIRSALLPGLGQVMDGSATKGILEFGTAATAAYFMFKYNAQSARDERNLQTALINYSRAASEVDAIAAHKTVGDGVKRLKRSQDTRTISRTAFIASYVLTLVDAFVFHTSRRLILARETELGYPSLINFSSSPAIRIGIEAPIN